MPPWTLDQVAGMVFGVRSAMLCATLSCKGNLGTNIACQSNVCTNYFGLDKVCNLGCEFLEVETDNFLPGASQVKSIGFQEVA